MVTSGTFTPIGKDAHDPTEAGIGKYHMRGTYTGLPTTVPIMAFATELFELPDAANSLLIDGLWPNEGYSTQRVVLGGTGRFRYAAGEVHEENPWIKQRWFLQSARDAQITESIGSARGLSNTKCGTVPTGSGSASGPEISPFTSQTGFAHLQ
jgi:hypothetical protein